MGGARWGGRVTNSALGAEEGSMSRCTSPGLCDATWVDSMSIVCADRARQTQQPLVAISFPPEKLDVSWCRPPPNAKSPATRVTRRTTAGFRSEDSMEDMSSSCPRSATILYT